LTQKPLDRLKTVSLDLAQQLKQSQILLVASSLAYTTILSIIPLLAVSFAIFQAFGGLDKLYAGIEPFIVANLAEGTGDEATAHIREFITNAHGSALGFWGLIGLIFTSMSMLSSVEKAINRIWNVPVSRSLFYRIASYWLFITLGPLAMAVAFGVATSTDIPLSHLFPSGTGMFLLTVAGLFAVYKWVPHCRVRPNFAGIAAGAASVFFILAQDAFRLYTAKVLTYSKIYGSLGAVPILLLWIYIVWIIILSGAALTASLQKRYPELASLPGAELP
jgi:membrane protein